MKPCLLFDESLEASRETAGTPGDPAHTGSRLHNASREEGMFGRGAGGWTHRAPSTQAVRNRHQPAGVHFNIAATEPGEDHLLRDLNLPVLFHAMAGSDQFLRQVARQVVPEPLQDVESILYRQHILTDVLHFPHLMRSLYGLASDTVEEVLLYRERIQPNYAQVVSMGEKLQQALGLLERLLARTGALRALLSANKACCQSKGLAAFHDRVESLMTDAFLKQASLHVAELRTLGERGRLVLGSSLGPGLKGTGHILRGIAGSSGFSLFGWHQKSPLPREETGTISLDSVSLARSAGEMQDAALVHVLRTINRFSDGLFRFFETLRFEAGFYAGCLNLYETLVGMGVPLCLPEACAADEKGLFFEHLVDCGLALADGTRPVGNSLSAPHGSLYLVTGANQGGKSTFLRSVGLAQLLLQCGLFVSAKHFRAPLRDAVFTHFARPEDAGMVHGRLDEELARMDAIVRQMTGRSMLLLNESFATTTERAGARIALDLIPALHAHGVEILYVTHLYEFADGIRGLNVPGTVFLRAERAQDGRRSFRMEEGDPLPTSYGGDLYEALVERESHDGH